MTMASFDELVLEHLRHIRGKVDQIADGVDALKAGTARLVPSEKPVASEAGAPLGDVLAELGREIGLTNEDLDVVYPSRSKAPAEPLALGDAAPTLPVGKIKSFGPFGPKYEVGQLLRQLDDGDWMVEITMVETGEKTEYRWTSLREDMEAR